MLLDIIHLSNSFQFSYIFERTSKICSVGNIACWRKIHQINLDELQTSYVMEGLCEKIQVLSEVSDTSTALVMYVNVSVSCYT